MAEEQSVTEQLNEIVRKAIGNSAMTAEALGQFVELQKKFEEMSKSHDTYKRMYTTEYSKNKENDDLIIALKRKLEGFDERVAKAAVLEQQAKMDAFERKFFLARGDELRSILSDMFRNIQTHRTIASNVVVPATPANPNNTYGSPAYTTPVHGSETESNS